MRHIILLNDMTFVGPFESDESAQEWLDTAQRGLGLILPLWSPAPPIPPPPEGVRT